MSKFKIGDLIIDRNGYTGMVEVIHEKTGQIAVLQKPNVTCTYDHEDMLEHLPVPVRCKECRHVHSDDCPLAEYEFLSPFDEERTCITNCNINTGYCCVGEQADNPELLEVGDKRIKQE